ncbi:MAG: response regulator transcription factor [Chloroflexota bacterium]|nr:response regulator transcription factor [Chloroflexota bacterium]
MSIRLLLADDHGVVREGVQSLLADYSEFLVVAEAGDGHQAIELTRQVQPDVVILDLMLPGIDGLQVVQRLHQAYPDTKVIVLSARTESEVVSQVMAAGADGYVSKMRCTEDLINALHIVTKGKCFISSGLGGQPPAITQGWADPGSGLSRLTVRERQVMSMVAAGLGNKQIARKLGISIHTVRNHRQRLMDKLDVHDTATLTRMAIAWGVLDQMWTENWNTA